MNKKKKKIIYNTRVNTGLVYAKEKPTDFILGASPLDPPPIIFKDGHGWADFRAKPEMQFNENFDTYSCVLYGIAKALVAYLKKVYDVDTTISEMFNAFYAGVRPGEGTTVRNGLESFRKKGWVKDEDYPFTPDTTLAQFLTKPPKEIIIKAEGQLSKWKVHWEQLDYSGNVSHELIKKELKRTPILATGFAWASYYGEGVYYDYNNPPNHLFMIDDWADEKDYDLIAYDSYPQDNVFDEDSAEEEFVKKLGKSYRIWSAHRIFLTPINQINNYNLLDKIKSMFKKISRDIKGGFWFIKGNRKQKIEDWKAAFGAIVDEIGVEKNNLSEEELKAIPNYTFFK